MDRQDKIFLWCCAMFFPVIFAAMTWVEILTAYWGWEEFFHHIGAGVFCWVCSMVMVAWQYARRVGP